MASWNYFVIGSVVSENVFTNAGIVMNGGDEELVCSFTCIKVVKPPSSPCDQGGTTTTTKIPSPATCGNKTKTTCMNGDPHYVTWDGTYFDYHGTCPYIFVMPCTPKGIPGFENFSIKAQNNIISTSPHPVAVVDSIQFEIYQQKIYMTLLGDLYINEQRQYYPYFYPNEANPKVTIRQNGWLKTIETEKGINVAFNGYTVCVTIPDCDAFYGKDKLCGLGGNYDGICANDVVYKNGTMPPPLVPCRFGNTISDWANSFITSNYFYPNNATKECKVGSNSNGCNRIEAGSVVACKPISDAATGTGVFKQCKAMGNDVIERMNEACKYDVCLIKELNGTDLGDWRAATNCPAKQCPANSSFKTCVQSCQPTCKNPNPTGCNVNSCIEGCQCNTGFVIDNTKTPFTCIKAEECKSCVGTFPNYPTISNNCTVFKTCWKGKRISRPYQCDINEQCGKSSEVESCQSQSCPQGWRFFDKTKACYKTIYNVSFDQAQAQCQTLGSNLVSINSLEENEFVRSMIYIGTSDIELTDDTYIGFKNGKWIDGTPVNYTNGAVMPDPFLIEHKVLDYCWFMISDNPSPEYFYLQGQWYISNCDRVFRTAVCKKI
uniref:Uncharacterized protein n=1 Tax=Panagrolaimus davidi TaxID=227884 RepID=A0A914Q589_9BILA